MNYFLSGKKSYFYKNTQNLFKKENKRISFSRLINLKNF